LRMARHNLSPSRRHFIPPAGSSCLATCPAGAPACHMPLPRSLLLLSGCYLFSPRLGGGTAPAATYRYLSACCRYLTPSCAAGTAAFSALRFLYDASLPWNTCYFVLRASRTRGVTNRVRLRRRAFSRRASAADGWQVVRLLRSLVTAGCRRFVRPLIYL
jgi:hypothetical protein